MPCSTASKNPTCCSSTPFARWRKSSARSELELRALEHEHGALGERQRKAQGVLAELGEQLDLCFANRNEDLARKVIKRRLETERLERHVGERRAALDRELATRRGALAEQREQLDMMRQKAELLTATVGDDWSKTELAIGDAEVEVALLRERQKRQPS